jgi:hypothetical protein
MLIDPSFPDEDRGILVIAHFFQGAWNIRLSVADPSVGTGPPFWTREFSFVGL